MVGVPFASGQPHSKPGGLASIVSVTVVIWTRLVWKQAWCMEKVRLGYLFQVILLAQGCYAFGALSLEIFYTSLAEHR